MRLIYEATGKEVKVGDIAYTKQGEPVEVEYFAPPHKPSSEGKFSVKRGGEFYVSVIGAKWIEREDRGEGPLAIQKFHLRMYQMDQYPDFRQAYRQEAVYSVPLPEGVAPTLEAISPILEAVETALRMKDADFSVHFRICEADSIAPLAILDYVRGERV